MRQTLRCPVALQDLALAGGVSHQLALVLTYNLLQQPLDRACAQGQVLGVCHSMSRWYDQDNSVVAGERNRSAAPSKNAWRKRDPLGCWYVSQNCTSNRASRTFAVQDRIRCFALTH